MMNKQLKYGIFAALSLCYWGAYTGNLTHIIAFHEQHHLFLYTKAYFEQQIQSEGFFSYLTNFIIQFFYYPAVGSALLAILLASVYLLTSHMLRLLFGKEDLLHLGVIPSLALFYHTMEASHTLTPVITTVVMLCLAVLFLSLFRRYTPLIPVFKNRHLKSRKLRMGLTGIALLSYSVYGYVHFVTHYNRNEGIILKAEMNVKARDWEKVLKYTTLFLNGGQTDHLITYFHHLALYHQGMLPNRLFNYPLYLGIHSLYFPWNSHPRECEYGHYLYEDLGHINEAHHWAFEAMAVWGETAPHLLNLARYNIVNHRPKVAQRFINKLKQSLFYQEEAKKLEAVLESGKVEGLRNAVSGVVDVPARFTNAKDIGPELEYLCNLDPTNRMAFEYYMSYLLLSNNIIRMVENLHRIEHFDYPSLPQTYEEALVIYKLRVGDEQFAKSGYHIRPETEKRFERYFQLMENQQIPTLQKEFGNTLWFYLNYIYPHRKK